jgi:hypothetical protein
MHSRWKRRVGLCALIGAVAYGAVGCAAERAPINRVQPNALSKHFFVGADLSNTADDPEFYMRNTVIDVPYGAAQDGLFTATYAQPMTRVKWQVTENALIARQTHERVTDSDHLGTRTSNAGQVVAMFRIESHFDIRRAYNPSTGEEMNVIEENGSDRPWYQREYMRIDWSSNQVTDGYEVDTLSMIGLFGGVKWAPMSFADLDPNSPNAPVVDDKTGYFDVTTKAFATPQVLDTPWGTYPACWFPASWGGSEPYGNCNPTEVTLRLSFQKRVDHDFEPEDWDGNKMEAFGWFTEDRLGYERNYGITDMKWHRFAAKYNIWEKSHVEGSQCGVDFWRDANGKIQNYQVDDNSPDGFAHDGTTGLPIPSASGRPYPGGTIGEDLHTLAADKMTEKVCQLGDKHVGSRCDEFTNKCTLPLRERKLKTIPWYYGPGAPADLFPSTAFALNSWNVAVKRAAVIGMRADALRVGDQQLADDLNYALDEDALLKLSQNDPQTLTDLGGRPGAKTNIFTLCHNPVIDTDDPTCGAPGLVARIGDIRYNSINIIDNPQNPSPWGIMVDANDPLTGEKVSTSVNEWGHVLDLASQNAVDLVKWFNGEISDEDITNGSYMKFWTQASDLGSKQYKPDVLSQQDIKSRLESIDTSLSKLNGLTDADAKLPKVIQQMTASKNLAAATGPSVDRQIEANRQRLIGSKWELELLSPEQLQAAGFDPSTPAAGNDAIIGKASPLRGMNPALRRWVNRMKSVTMAQRASCMVEQPEPSAVAGLARQASKLYPLPDRNDPNFPALYTERDKKMHQWIREQFHISVIEHEMGHSMGLRHNFVSNVDALNFHTQYWQLRTNNGAQHFCGYKNSPNDKLDPQTPHTNGDDCVGPRWVDPLTDTEVNGLIWRWGATSVMDYPGDITQDMNDLGQYDKAAMRFLYGQVVDVDKDTGSGGKPNAKGLAYIDALDGFGGIGGQTIGSNHYSTYADKYGVLGTCKGGSGSDPLTAKCSGFDLDYVPRADMKTVPKYPQYPAILKYRPDLVAFFAQDKDGRVRHPYMFGSDEYADTGNVPVFRFDSGADAYEQIQFLTSVYENRYIFDNFRRNRVGFNTFNVNARVQSRYFEKLQGMVKSLALLAGFAQNANLAKNDPGDLMPLALGATDAMKTFVRILTRPEPGPYFTKSSTTMPFAGAEDLNGLLNNPNGEFKIALGSGQGRYLHNDYDYSKGYWWSSFQKFAGTNLEKRGVIDLMLESYNNFVANAKEDYIDGRYKNLSFASVFPNQVRRLLSNMMQTDGLAFGPYVQVPSTMPKDNILTVQFLPWDRYDSVQTQNLDYPADTGNLKTTVLDPLVGWEQQYPGLVSAFIYGRTMLTMDVIDQMRIWTPNGIEGTYVADVDQLRFRDPVSGIVYAAKKYGTETVNSKLPAAEKAMGARMIQYANSLAA